MSPAPHSVGLCSRGRTLEPPALASNRERLYSAIERMFCRLRDFPRVATRYDRNAVNFLAAVCIAAAIGYWL
jgi:hypothetical protein